MRIYRPNLLNYLFIFIVLISGVSGATNFYERHGNNFIYLENTSPDEYDTLTYAPVIWDIGAAFFELHKYYGSYGWESSDDCDSSYKAIDLLMSEAWDHGVNFANARGEILRMSTTDLLSGPDSLDYFVSVARIMREDSLHLIAGGFKTDTTLSGDAHNDAVISYLSDYSSWRVGPGEFIGVFGFDEPDARYEGPGWDQCQYNTEWYDLVKDYAETSRNSISSNILPFGTFLDRYRTQDEDNLWYQQTIPLFCEELEYPVFDKYPCKYSNPDDRSYPDQIEFDEIIGSTDLMPSGSVDYYAYADQDEIFAVDGDGWFRVFQFDNVTSHSDTIEVSRIDSILLPSSIRSDPIWAASDFRAVDVGNRDSDSNRLNGAVVFFNPSDPHDQMIIFHDGSDIVFLEDALKMPVNALSTTAVCVGEYNYPVHHPTASLRRGSLISHGELRILVCYKARKPGQIVDRARVFAWNYITKEFSDVTGDSHGLILDFEPAKAVWGVFWPTYNYWHAYNSEDQSGFVILGSSGNYQSIYEYTPQGTLVPEWTVSDGFTNLFEWDETSFIARKTWGFPGYTAGTDYICHLNAGFPRNTAVLEFATGPGGNPNSSLNVYESSPIDLPGSYDFLAINDAASCRPLTFYDDALVISFDDGSGGSEVYKSTSQINFQGGDDISITLDSDTLRTLDTDDSPLLTAARVYNVRQPYRVPLVSNPEEYPQQIELLIGDIPVENSRDNFADQHEALDTMFVYGIEGTSRSNCLIHNLRCEGRRQDGQLTFYPSSDTLLYLMTTSLVHGSRGIHLRALSFTMMCGNGGGSAQAGTYRSPPLLLNWGPSVETTNPDMLGRLHDVVQSITGKNTSDPDFMSALISDDWDIMDSDDAENALYFEIGGWETDLDNDSLNFISLIESSSDDILLLVINDSPEILDDSTSNYYYIHFPNKNGLHYTTHYVAGYAVEEVDFSPDLAISFFEIPGYTASLYWFERD